MGNNLVTPSDNLEPIPLINEQATILGVSVVFSSLVVAAVVLRLYARFKLAHAAGWDDLLVSLAAVCRDSQHGNLVLKKADILNDRN